MPGKKDFIQTFVKRLFKFYKVHFFLLCTSSFIFSLSITSFVTLSEASRIARRIYQNMPYILTIYSGDVCTPLSENKLDAFIKETQPEKVKKIHVETERCKGAEILKAGSAHTIIVKTHDASKLFNKAVEFFPWAEISMQKEEKGISTLYTLKGFFSHTLIYSMILSFLAFLTFTIDFSKRRTAEFKVAKALGASRKKILHLLLGELTLPFLAGATPGVILLCTLIWTGETFPAPAYLTLVAFATSTSGAIINTAVYAGVYMLELSKSERL